MELELKNFGAGIALRFQFRYLIKSIPIDGRFSHQLIGAAACGNHENLRSSDLHRGQPLPQKRAKFSTVTVADAADADTDAAFLTEVDSYFHERAVQHDWSKGLYHPLYYWKENQHRFPWLSKLAIDVLGVLASTGSVERAFSVATDILSAKR